MKDHLKPAVYIGLVLGAVIGAFALLWTYTYRDPGNYLPRDFGVSRANIEAARRCETADVAFIGASAAVVGFAPKALDLGPSVHNFALISTTPIEGYYMAKRLFACPSPPKTVVLAYGGYDFAESAFYWPNSAKFGLFDYADMQEIARTEAQVGEHILYNSAFGAEPPASIKNYLYQKHFPPYETGSLLASKGGGRRAANAQLTAESAANGGQHLLGDEPCAEHAGWESTQSDFKPTRLHTVYMERLLTLLDAHHAQVLMLTPPINDMTYREMPAKYAKSYAAYFASLQARHPNLRMVGPLFTAMDRCQFTDDFHLNAKGVAAYTQVARQRLAPEIAAAASARVAQGAASRLAE